MFNIRNNNAAYESVTLLAIYRVVRYNTSMTIHHDKLAYGKLASNMEEMSEEEILKMLENLEEEEEQKSDENPSKNNDEK